MALSTPRSLPLHPYTPPDGPGLRSCPQAITLDDLKHVLVDIIQEVQKGHSAEKVEAAKPGNTESSG